MTDDGPKPPRRFRRPSELTDDEVVEIPPERVPLLSGEPFRKLVPTQTEQLTEVLGRQRKMALQLDGFGQAMNRRFDLFHQELALTRAEGAETRAVVDSLHALVTSGHGPRIEKVEKTLGQKAAKGGGIIGIVLLALPLLADILPKYRALFDSIGGFLQ